RLSFRQLLLATLAFVLAACGADRPEQQAAADTETVTVEPQGYTLVETVMEGSSEVVIPYSKYRLDNGLTVLIHEDHSDPLIHVDVTYHVGSSREEPQRSGFAHFFEHMMFQGS